MSRHDRGFQQQRHGPHAEQALEHDEPDDGERLANLSGPFDEHLRQIELRIGVEIANRGNLFRISGAAAPNVGDTITINATVARGVDPLAFAREVEQSLVTLRQRKGGQPLAFQK